MNIIGDTLCSPSVMRLLVPQLSLVSDPGSGTGQNSSVYSKGFTFHFSTKENVHGHLGTTSSCLTGEQQPAKLPILHFEFSYFGKFNTKWQMNANYTSIAQLKLELLSTGSFSNPSHSSSAYISEDLSLVPRDWQKSDRQPCLEQYHVYS